MTGRLSGQNVEEMLQAKPFSYSGNVDVNTIFYRSQGIQPRYLPFNYIISGSPILSIYGVDLPITFAVGKQHSGVMQPFNQFGLSPRYKNITLHAGYRNLNWSPFTLGGHTFLGGGVEFTAGKLRFGAIYGRFNKATALDTARSLFLSNFAFRRTGAAVKVGYGTEQDFFDIILVRAKDHGGSLKFGNELADTLGLAPASNTVVGYNTRLSFLKGRLAFESDGAISLYTNDVNAPGLVDSMYESRIRRLRNIADLNTSSEVYGAIQTAIRYKVNNMSVRLIYRYIDPGYKSMGSYWLNNDLENYTIAPALTLLNNKVRFSGSLGLQRDDLSKTKRAKAKKVIGSANLSADFNERASLDLSYSNYSVSQVVKTIRFADSLKVVQTSSQLSVMPRYVIPGVNRSHMFSLIANLSRARELNPARRDSLSNDITTDNIVFNYQLALVPQGASVFASLSNTRMQSELLRDMNRGVTVGGSKAWLQNKLQISGNLGYLFNKRNSERGRIQTGALHGRYNLHRMQALRLSIYYTDNTPETPSEIYPKYYEFRGEVGYTLTL